MMRVLEEEDFEPDDPVEELDEHAPAPAARRAAAVTAASFLWPRNLEIMFVSCPSKGRGPPISAAMA
jgi:hypothetical protein